MHLSEQMRSEINNNVVERSYRPPANSSAAAAERLQAAVMGAPELRLPPAGRGRRSSDRLRTRGVYTVKTTAKSVYFV